MRIRRLAGVAALVAAAGSLAAVPAASAGDPVSYGAGSDGRALSLSLFGQELTVGDVHSAVGSAPTAEADGAGIANPLSPVGVTEAAVAADGEAVDTGQQCGGELPEIPGLTLALACSSSAAGVTGGAPTATATAGVIEPLEIDPVGAVLDTPLADVVDDVQQGVDPLLDGLGEVLGPLDDVTGLELDDTVNDLLDALLEGAPLATVTVGTTEVTSGAITTTCTANGARVDVLDLPPVVGAIDPPPVISVIVGEAGTAVSVDAATATATPVVEPSLVTVVVPSIPALADGLAVEVGQTIEIPLPEPLGTSTISVADGETGTTDEGQTFARANSVLLDLLPGLEGGIRLSLAECASIAGAEISTTATTEPPATPTSEPTRLPRTGGTGADGWALAATIGFGSLGLLLVRRSRELV